MTVSVGTHLNIDPKQSMESKSGQVVRMLLQVETIRDLVKDWNESLPVRQEQAKEWNEELERKYEAGRGGCCTTDTPWWVYGCFS